VYNYKHYPIQRYQISVFQRVDGEVALTHLGVTEGQWK